ncbi:helix-turn-helix transcriptional regulator [bacterium]|nr:helix-turn-helix transcriptional regulator [bacterium]
MMYQNQELHFELNGKKFHCALDVAMFFLGGKWKTVILWYLKNGTVRFSELKRKIPKITEKMLSLQLRQMEKDGFVARKIYPEVPPRVEYTLSQEGVKLLPIIEELARWGRYKAEKNARIVDSRTGKTVRISFSKTRG